MRELGNLNIDWRTYRNLSRRRASEVKDAAYTLEAERTGKQKRAVQNAEWETRKREQRIANVSIAHGRVHTSSGVSVFIRRD